MLGAQITGIARSTDGRSVLTLADGDRLTCDAIVAGVGLVPNDELARDAGLACDGGVIVDQRCCTSDPDIFAAGDVAVTPNRWAGRRLRLESWQNAQEQGIAAARAALGLPVFYQPLPWFWSDQYGMNLQIYGVPLPSHHIVTRGVPGDNSFALFYLEGDVVKAALGANAARDVRFARRLIEQGKQVSACRLATRTFPWRSNKPLHKNTHPRQASMLQRHVEDCALRRGSLTPTVPYDAGHATCFQYASLSRSFPSAMRNRSSPTASTG